MLMSIDVFRIKDQLYFINKRGFDSPQPDIVLLINFEVRIYKIAGLFPQILVGLKVINDGLFISISFDQNGRVV